MKKSRFSVLITLFTSTFVLSAFTFGGGYVIVPLMRKKFVEKLRWIDDDEMLNMVAIAQTAPGPIAVNASILTGYKAAGFAGAAMALLGTALPPLITLSVISMFYAAFRANPIVGAVLRGMQAGVAAVVLDVVYTLCADITKLKKALPAILAVGAFAASFFFKVNAVFILLAGGLAGALAYARQKKRPNGTGPNESGPNGTEGAP